MNHDKSTCSVCTFAARIKDATKNRDVDKLIKLVDDLYIAWESEATEAEVANSILNGTWPGGKEQVLKALETYSAS